MPEIATLPTHGRVLQAAGFMLGAAPEMPPAPKARVYWSPNAPLSLPFATRVPQPIVISDSLPSPPNPQIALAGASGTADIDTLTRQVLAQLQSQQHGSTALHSQQSRPAPPPPQPRQPAARQHPVRPPTPARCPVPLSPGDDEHLQASPMDADTPPRRCQAGRAGDMTGATPQGSSGASAAVAGLERLHFDDECSS